MLNDRDVGNGREGDREPRMRLSRLRNRMSVGSLVTNTSKMSSLYNPAHHKANVGRRRRGEPVFTWICVYRRVTPESQKSGPKFSMTQVACYKGQVETGATQERPNQIENDMCYG